MLYKNAIFRQRCSIQKILLYKLTTTTSSKLSSSSSSLYKKSIVVTSSHHQHASSNRYYSTNDGTTTGSGASTTGGDMVTVGLSPHNNYLLSSPSSSNAKKQQKQKRKSSDRRTGKHHHRFLDRVRVNATGGSGGKGSQSLERIGRKHKRRPDGGHGGNGGSVIIMADPSHSQSLKWTRPHINAESGKHGSSQKKHGKTGQNLILKVPCGVQVRRILDHDEEWDEETQTIVKKYIDMDFDGVYVDTSGVGNSDDDIEIDDSDDEERNNNTNSNVTALGKRRRRHHHGPAALLSTDENDDILKDFLTDDDYDDDDEYNRSIPWEERTKIDIADLDSPGSYVVVARGGRGGVGNCVFASRNGTLPPPEIMAAKATPKPGERVHLELTLKLIADIGLVGFPNAGKSSLLAAMSRATPHIAPYPFTTMNPIIGYIEYQDGFRVCAADVPGLIEGAADGKGMGHDFLRHLERTKAMLYIVDAAGVDGRDPVDDLQILVDELGAYGGGEMLSRHALVVANKMDLLNESRKSDVMSRLTEFCNDANLLLQDDVIGISAGVSGEGLFNLSKSIRTTVSLCDDDY